MRKSILGIGCLCLVLLLTAGYCVSYQLSAGSDQADTKAVDAGNTQSYVICEEDGRLLVYLSDGQTVYEYTDISVSALPEDLQKAVEDGLVMKSNVELYGFLENYTS